MEKRIQEWTNARDRPRSWPRHGSRSTNERKRQAIRAALWFASGRIERGQLGSRSRRRVQSTTRYWQKQVNEFETEKQLRTSMAFGSLFFVLLGAPVGILFARRDFLSAFISCFVPIIIAVLPADAPRREPGQGRDDARRPMALWIGNIVLGVAGRMGSIRRSSKH